MTEKQQAESHKLNASVALIRVSNLEPEQYDELRKALGVDLLVHWPDGRTPEEVISVLDEKKMREAGWVRVADG